jgi:mono/diheme cytochrome c family protein
MAIRVRSILLGLLALLVVLVLVGITMVGWQVVLGPKARAVSDRKFQVTPERIARGEYLVNSVAGCFHCHSEHDLTKFPDFPMNEAKKGAGWDLPVPELGTVVAPNITPDPETGIGTWKDDEILRAIQEGVDNKGRALFPIMPWMNFARLNDEDAESIVVYLRTIKPVKNAVAVTKLIFPLSVLVKTMPQPKASHESAPRTTPQARGEYLVRVVAGCQDCHTPAKDGTPLPNMEFGGGGVFHAPGGDRNEVFSLNITQDPSGIAHYDEAMLIQTFHTGRVPGRVVNHIMPLEAYQTMKDDDIKDIWAYLKTQPPVKHRISNTDPPTLCPICGHTHGLGNLNVNLNVKK